jgi:hypothetical protein
MAAESAYPLPHDKFSILEPMLQEEVEIPVAQLESQGKLLVLLPLPKTIQNIKYVHDLFFVVIVPSPSLPWLSLAPANVGPLKVLKASKANRIRVTISGERQGFASG